MIESAARHSSPPRPATRRASPRSPTQATTRSSLDEMRTLGHVSADRQRLAADALATWPPTTPRWLPTSTTSPGRLPRRWRSCSRSARPAVRREPPPAGGLLPRDDPPLRHARGREPAPGRPVHVQRPPGPRRGVPDRGRLHCADRCIVKHANPVGLASADNLAEAYRRALETDPVDAFGAIVGVNRELDEATAQRIAANAYEAVVAPGLRQRRGSILGRSRASRCCLPAPPTGLTDYGIADLDFQRIEGGLLVETRDRREVDRPSSRSSPSVGRPSKS